MSLTATYMSDLSRVRLSADSLGGSATYAVVERSANESIWETVRGGADPAVTSAEIEDLDDYEFYAGATTFYRITSFDDSDTEQEQFTTSIVASLDGRVWLKNLRYPLLNQVVTVADYGTVDLPARSSAWPVAGRSLPVGTTDLLGGRNHPLLLATESDVEDAKLQLSLRASGTWFVHVPTDPPVGREGNALLPGSMYVQLASAQVTRVGGVSRYQHYLLSLTEVAPPGPLVVGTTLTWETVKRLYGSWTAVWAAHSTWRSLWGTIGDSSDVVTL